MLRPTEEAETLFKNADRRFAQAALHLTQVQSGSLEASQIVFRLALAMDDQLRAEMEMVEGMGKLAIAIRQVYDKLERG